MAYSKKLSVAIYLLSIAAAAVSAQTSIVELPSNDTGTSDKGRIFGVLKPEYQEGAYVSDDHSGHRTGHEDRWRPHRHGGGRSSSSDEGSSSEESTRKCAGSFPMEIWHTRSFEQPCGFERCQCKKCANPLYRELDGTCNHEKGFGAANTPYLRIGKARYADGVSKVMKWTSSGRLPLARVLSVTLYKDKNRPHERYSVMVMQWSQLVAHDIGYQHDYTKSDGSLYDCCRSERREKREEARAGDLLHDEGEDGEHCYPIVVPRDDPFYSRYHHRCMNFVRSQVVRCRRRRSSLLSRVVRSEGESEEGSASEKKDSDGESASKEGKDSDEDSASKKKDSDEESASNEGKDSDEKEGSEGSSSDEEHEGGLGHDQKAVNQLNHESCFVDMSPLYGRNDKENALLRVGRGGLLKTREVNVRRDGGHSSEESHKHGGRHPRDTMATEDNEGSDDSKPSKEQHSDDSDGDGYEDRSSSASKNDSDEDTEEDSGDSRGGHVSGLDDRDIRDFPPLVDDPHGICHAKSKKDVCYLTGDERANHQPLYASLIAVFIREHNRIARRLHDLHPDWCDKKLFQEARRIVIAILQKITWTNYLPKILGKKIMEKMDMMVDVNKRGEYDSGVNPSAINEFSAGAFRYLHTLIPGTIELQGEGRCTVGSLRMSDHFFNPSVLEKGHKFEQIIRGMTNTPSQKADQFISKEVTRLLYKVKKAFGEDLASKDIQRSRDHGIPGYNDMRHMCGLPKAVDFDDLKDVMSGKSIFLLKKLYRSVNDVDFFVGGSLEEHCVDGDTAALVGPTFACVIAEQFYRLRKGDRYFFDHEEGPGTFTKAQYKALSKVSLAGILCENMKGLKYMQRDAFRVVSPANELMRCEDIPKLSLRAWRDHHPKKNCK